jgi:hypothetical protein
MGDELLVYFSSDPGAAPSPRGYWRYPVGKKARQFGLDEIPVVASKLSVRQMGRMFNKAMIGQPCSTS